MKFLLFFLIPFSLFSQTPDYPDTLYLKSGQVHSCIITQIDESRIILQYGKQRETTVFLMSVDKIVLNPVGVVYTKESGFNKELHQLQYAIEERNKKNAFPNSNTIPHAQQNNLNLILFNGDAISNFSTQKLVGDSIMISHLGEAKLIAIESIIAIRKVAKSEFWKGAGIGFFAGAAAGLLILAATYEKPKSSDWNINIGPPPEVAVGVLGGLAGFFVGGVIGTTAGEDEIYDLSHMNPERKLKKIREELSKQNESR